MELILSVARAALCCKHSGFGIFGIPALFPIRNMRNAEEQILENGQTRIRGKSKSSPSYSPNFNPNYSPHFSPT